MWQWAVYRLQGSKLRGVSSYIHLCDFYATFCGLAGVDAADDGALDAVGSALPGVDSLDMCVCHSPYVYTNMVHQCLLSVACGERDCQMYFFVN